jgi:hypothetical protein
MAPKPRVLIKVKDGGRGDVSSIPCEGVMQRQMNPGARPWPMHGKDGPNA